MTSSIKTIPTAMFPQLLDDNSSLMHVFNTSEAKLLLNFTMDDDIIYIEPRKWEEPRKWSFDGGFLNIEGEVLYYKEVELQDHPNPPNMGYYDFFNDPNISEDLKNEYRRVIAFKNIIRIQAYSPRTHYAGEWARGYVMSEHHNHLKQALLGIENLIGIDNSEDHKSIDYRLRDLKNLEIEKDDLNCPYGVFWYKILQENESSINVQFFISIIGDYESYAFVPEAGAEPITNNLNPIYTYDKKNINPLNSSRSFLVGSNSPANASLTVLKERCCSCISSSSVPCEPCEFDALLDDLPILSCPDIQSWEIPSITFECPQITCEVAEYAPCTILTCPEASPTNTIVITGLSEISVSIPEIIISTNIPPITVDINVNWNREGDDSDAEGACFRLIPCGGTTS